MRSRSLKLYGCLDCVNGIVATCVYIVIIITTTINVEIFVETGMKQNWESLVG